jgi:nitrogenase molybdenum-iron protein alpha/beta subunit
MSEVVKGTKPAAETVRENEERLYDAEVKRVRERMKSRVDAIRASKRVSHKDLQVVINTRG